MAKGNPGHPAPVSAKATLQTSGSAAEPVDAAACSAFGHSDSGHEEAAPDFDIGEEVEAQWMEPADDGEALCSC